MPQTNACFSCKRFTPEYKFDIDLTKYLMKFCNLIFTLFIMKHRKEKHVDPEGNFLCKLCDKKYPSYKFMGQHMRDKHQRQPFECIGM